MSDARPITDEARKQLARALAAAQDQSEHRECYARIGEEWNRRFNVREIVPTKSLGGRAWPAARKIHGPWPTTTRNRLYIWAHEVGHVALMHVGQRPVYVEEYEAERFAQALMREAGLRVPRKMVVRGRRYVQHKIAKALHHGLRQLDPKIAVWSGVKIWRGRPIQVGKELVLAPGFELRRSRKDYFADAQLCIALTLSITAISASAMRGKL